MGLSQRVKSILIHPKAEWEVIAREPASIAEIYTSYVVLLAAILPVAVIARSMLGFGAAPAGVARPTFGGTVIQAIGEYVLGLVTTYLFALIVDWLAPRFSGQPNRVQAFKLVAYSTTPAWLAGVFELIPALSFLVVLGVYSIYLLYVGVPVLMTVPPEKAAGYTVAVFIVAVVVFVVLGIVVRLPFRSVG
jgi:hypothetical protein